MWWGMREREENASGLDGEIFRPPVACTVYVRSVEGFVRRIRRVSHKHCAGVRARRLNRRRLASGLGTVLQPAARVPSLRHSGFNGTNDNRHPCLRRSFADVQSANPSLHSSIQLKNNVPEKAKHQKTKDKGQRTKDIFYLFIFF